MRGARRRPAPEEDVKTDQQIDQSDESLRLQQTPVKRLGNDWERRVQCDSTAVYVLPDGRLVCAKCGLLLDLEITAIAPG